jgi:hypothetical protein
MFHPAQDLDELVAKMYEIVDFMKAFASINTLLSFTYLYTRLLTRSVRERSRSKRRSLKKVKVARASKSKRNHVTRPLV